MLSFVIAEEDLRIETSYPFNKVTAVFLLDNYRFSSYLTQQGTLIISRTNYMNQTNSFSVSYYSFFLIV